MATQEGDIGANPTQVGATLDDNYDSSDEEELAKRKQASAPAASESTGTAALLGGGGDDEEEDEEFKPETKAKRKLKKRIVSDDDDDESEEEEPKKEATEGNIKLTSKTEDRGDVGDDDEGSSSDDESSSEEEPSDEDDDAMTKKKKKRAPSARQETKRKRTEETERKKKEEKKKTEVQMSSFDQIISGLKKAKKKELSVDEKKRLVEETMDIMSRAFEQDRKSRKNHQPALAKLEKLDLVIERLTDQQLLHTFVDRGVGHEIVNWLRPGKKELPNIKLRTKLLKVVERLPFPEVEDSIKSSGIGKILNFYRCHPDETLDNKRVANAVISRWMDIMTKQSG